MIALWLRRLWPYALPCLVLGAILVVLTHRRTLPSRRVAHHATIYAEHYVYRTDTLYRRDTVRYRAAVTSYRSLRDTLHLTDTGAVRTVLARADAGFRLCDSLVASSARTITARDSLVAAVRTELAIADQPGPRLSTRALALYDPIARVPAASLDASLRLTGRLSLVARVDQRFSPGERLRGYVGASLAF